MDRRELLAAIATERAKLPAVDHNGRPATRAWNADVVEAAQAAAGPAPEPEVPTGPRNPMPDPSQGARGGMPAPSLEAQIAEAMAAGQPLRALRLQRSKLDNIARPRHA